MNRVQKLIEAGETVKVYIAVNFEELYVKITTERDTLPPNIHRLTIRTVDERQLANIITGLEVGGYEVDVDL